MPICHLSASVAEPASEPPAPSSSSDYGLPPFVKPLSRSVDEDELHLLRKRGVFRVPDSSFLTDAFRAYYIYAHWSIPIFDLASVLLLLPDHNILGSRLSLSLLWAVIFVACPYLDVAAIGQRGYGSDKHLRQLARDHAKVSRLTR